MEREIVLPSGPPPRLFDERSRPDFREVYSGLLRSTAHLDVALTSIRLSTLDFASGELSRLRSVRLLLAEVRAMALEGEAHAAMLQPRKRNTLILLSRLLEKGVIQVRSAPLGGWAPDFSVFRSPEGAFALVLGYHWFERPFAHQGPALTSLHGPEGARLARVRFQEIWRRAHDISPAVGSILARAERELEGQERASSKGTRQPAPEVSTRPGNASYPQPKAVAAQQLGSRQDPGLVP